MKILSILKLAGLSGVILCSSCRAWERGEARKRTIEDGPEPIPTGPPRDYARYGIVPDDESPAAADRNYVTTASRYPVATRTTRDGFVRSPYEPYELINVKGFPSGNLVKDPKTGQVFRVP